MAEGLILVDSSIWIEGIDPRASVGLKSRFAALIETERIAVTEIVRLEVIGGTRSAGEFEKARSEFEAFACLKAGGREWKRAEEIGFALNRRGQRVPSADVLIAAVAACYQVPLWHMDADFECIRTVVSGLHTFWYPKQNPAI